MTPKIQKYLEYRTYLSDWFAWKKSNSPRFSHRGFVRRVGQKSPSLILDLMAGRRRLTPQMVGPFAEAMKLSAGDRRYLALLVELERAKTPEQRNAVWDQISAKRRFEAAHNLEGGSFRYLSDWCYPAIRELALRPDFKADPEWVASMMEPRISIARAREALQALFELGMLVEGDDGVVQADGAIVTPSEVTGLAVHNYHQGMIDRARDGIVDVGPKERHYTGVTVCIPEALMPKIKDEINRFAERLLDLCDGSEEGAERVYQFHMMAFPLSRSTRDDP